jgi:hypothetical protein
VNVNVRVRGQTGPIYNWAEFEVIDRPQKMDAEEIGSRLKRALQSLIFLQGGVAHHQAQPLLIFQFLLES